MAKRIISVIVALIVAFAVIMGFEHLSGIIFKTPDGGVGKSIAEIMANMPMAAFLWLLLGYGVASFLGGLIATFISGRTAVQSALIVGGVLTAGGISNLIMLPYHPLWFMIVNVLEYVPLAWIGFLVARKKV